MLSSIPKPPSILESASGEVNRIRRLIEFLRSQIASGRENPPDNPKAPLPKPPLLVEEVLEKQREVWIRIFEHLKITTLDPNNKDVKSGALFEAMEKVAKKISEVDRTGNIKKSDKQETSTYSFLENNNIKEQEFKKKIKYEYNF
ncbi:26153_t:CDS:1 [Dentiscutata erythropus]|uniref:26153_t:CDS:1 n=1 Tax=Dentiscutata erythropus TaxID=1348616 RepID=A0A9N9JSG7_9GLOM|nr:26153_t:CDS:1 [Dentiscutata erythropus]